MNRTVFSALAFAGILLGSVSAAQAYDPLCDKIKKSERRALCQCRSDAGAAVSRRPNNDGRMIIDANRVRGAKLSQVHDCMIKKGFKPEG